MNVFPASYLTVSCVQIQKLTNMLQDAGEMYVCVNVLSDAFMAKRFIRSILQ